MGEAASKHEVQIVVLDMELDKGLIDDMIEGQVLGGTKAQDFDENYLESISGYAGHSLDAAYGKGWRDAVKKNKDEIVQKKLEASDRNR